MGKKVIEPQGLHKPLGTYSHVVEAIGSKLVLISGQVPLDPSGKLIGPDDLSAQIGQVLANLKAAVEAAGGNVDDICKITIFLADKAGEQSDVLPVVRNGIKDFFGGTYPASSLVYVSRLASPDWLIELEALAAF